MADSTPQVVALIESWVRMDCVPSLRGTPVKHAIAKLFLRVNGWEFEGEIPSVPSFVLLAAPHTSNWDLPYLLAFAWYANVDMSWMGKHQIFAGPQGPFMKALGGIPVRRDRKNDLVSQMAKEFSERGNLILTVPPEGTRKRAPHWKSGFYRIAIAAGVPIIPSFLDYSRRRGGFGPPLVPTGNVTADMDILRAFYQDRKGKHPDDFGPIKLAEEVEADSAN